MTAAQIKAIQISGAIPLHGDIDPSVIQSAPPVRPHQDQRASLLSLGGAAATPT